MFENTKVSHSSSYNNRKINSSLFHIIVKSKSEKSGEILQKFILAELSGKICDMEDDFEPLDPTIQVGSLPNFFSV